MCFNMGPDDFVNIFLYGLAFVKAKWIHIAIIAATTLRIEGYGFRSTIWNNAPIIKVPVLISGQCPTPSLKLDVDM